MAEYRLKSSLERIGDLELKIDCLENLDQTIDDLFAELERAGNPQLLGELCPYFGTVWPSARALARSVWSRASDFQGKRVLELGCGLALPSITAAKLGASVVATDFHPEVPRFLRRNLELNGVSVEYFRVDWSKGFPELGEFDWVVGSDILYERQHALLLPKTLAKYMTSRSAALVCDPARPYLQAFVDATNQYGFQSQISVPSRDIFLIEIAKGIAKGSD